MHMKVVSSIHRWFPSPIRWVDFSVYCQDVLFAESAVCGHLHVSSIRSPFQYPSRIRSFCLVVVSINYSVTSVDIFPVLGSALFLIQYKCVCVCIHLCVQLLYFVCEVAPWKVLWTSPTVSGMVVMISWQGLLWCLASWPTPSCVEPHNVFCRLYILHELPGMYCTCLPVCVFHCLSALTTAWQFGSCHFVTFTKFANDVTIFEL